MKKFQVAIIDDNEIDGMVVRTFIKSDFNSVDVFCFTSMDGLLACNKKADVFILDIHIDGYPDEVLANIKTLEEINPHAYIIVASSTVNTEEISNVLANGASSFISKGSKKQREHIKYHINKIKTIFDFKNDFKNG